MKYLLIIIATLLFVFSSPAQRTDTLTILHVNDTHGNLSSGGPRTPGLHGTIGGLARAATIIGTERMQDPSALLLHAGDAFTGDLSFNALVGIPEFEAMESLGFDAMVMGNHEFDLTPTYFFFSLGQSGMTVPVISSNCILKDSTLLPLKPYIQPFTVIDVKGVKVGIFGMTTPEANVLSMAMPEAFIDTLIVETALAMVDSLRNARGCQTVIMLSHLGIDLDRKLANAIPGIDAVIGGHDHVIPTPSEILVPSLGGTDIPVVQAGAFYHHVGRLRLTVSSGKTSFLDWTAIPLDQSVPEEPQVVALVDALESTVEQIYGAPFFSSAIAMVQEFCDERADSLAYAGNHDTPVGNLVTDAFRAITQTDVAFTACGSTAQPLYKGPIIANDIMRMIGYGYNDVDGLGFRLVTFSVPGAAIFAGLQYGLSNALQSGNDEYLMQVSGMRYDYATTIDNSGQKPRTDGTITSVSIAARPLDPTAMYSVTCNEFVFGIFQLILAQMHITPVNVVLADSVTEFSVVTDHVIRLTNVTPSVEGRVRCVSVSDAGRLAEAPIGLELRHFPNPAEDRATVVFTLARASEVSLALFDNAGRKVADVLSGHRPAGTHTIPLNVKPLASGQYHCVLSADGHRTSRLVTIVR